MHIISTGHRLFIFDSPIISRTIIKSRLIPDWSVGNVNPDMTPNGMLLDVNILPKKKKRKKNATKL